MESATLKPTNRAARRLGARLRRRGLTLIEAAMVLAILAVVLGGVMLYYSQANQSRQTSEAAGQIAAVQTAVRSVYAGQANFNGLSDAQLSQSLPAKMVNVSDNSLHHSFGGQLYVAPADAGGGAASGFVVTMAGVPQQACIKLASQDMGRSTTGIGISASNASSASVISAGSTVGTDVPPLSPTTAQSKCSGSANTLTWLFF